MKALCLAVAVALVVTAPLAAQDSPLAAAAKKAKEDRAKGMGWPAPVAPAEIATGQKPVEPAAAEPSSTAATTTTTATSTTTTSTSTTKDEPYWKGRMRAVTTKLRDDQNQLDAAIAVEQSLNTQVHRPLDSNDAIRDKRQFAVVENQWQDAVKDVSRLKALVKSDTQAKADFELEAHKAGVPPGWLVLE